MAVLQSVKRGLRRRKGVVFVAQWAWLLGRAGARARGVVVRFRGWWMWMGEREEVGRRARERAWEARARAVRGRRNPYGISIVRDCGSCTRLLVCLL